MLIKVKLVLPIALPVQNVILIEDGLMKSNPSTVEKTKGAIMAILNNIILSIASHMYVSLVTKATYRIQTDISLLVAVIPMILSSTVTGMPRITLFNIWTHICMAALLSCVDSTLLGQNPNETTEIEMHKVH